MTNSLLTTACDPKQNIKSVFEYAELSFSCIVVMFDLTFLLIYSTKPMVLQRNR